jgi:hypothetical protein
MEILLGNFSAKVGKKNFFKPTTGNGSLQEINNDNEVRVVNFAHSRILESKVQCCHITTFINILGDLHIGNP